MNIKQYKPIHPGLFINKVYIKPFNLGSNEVARLLGVNNSTFNRLINGKSDISPSMALRLSKVLGRSPESWLVMQDNFSLYQVEIKEAKTLSQLKQIDFSQDYSNLNT